MPLYATATFFLVLSGAAALVYQVVWVRLLSLSMGSTAASVATVLAAFFLGIATGSYLAERLTRDLRDLRVYLALEALIAMFGLALLPALLGLDSLLAALPSVGASLGAKFALTVLLLAPPTICMGATFPVMAALLVRRQADLGNRLSHIYSFNTLGAVLGALLSGFVLVPRLGLDGAVWVAATLNITIVVIGVSINRRISLEPLEEVHAAVAALDHGEPSLRGRALAVLFVTGLVSIAVEVGWTKYLSILTGATLYGFSAILAIFLSGIAAGSQAAKAALSRHRARASWLIAGLLMLGMSLLASRSALSAAPLVHATAHSAAAGVLAGRVITYGFVAAVLMVPTLVFGALFPISLELYCGNVVAVRSLVGRAYAVNTVAGILGSSAAGFWVIPSYGTDTLLVGLALLVLAAALLFIDRLVSTAGRIATVTAVALGVGAGLAAPGLDYAGLIGEVADVDVEAAGAEPRFLYLREGKAGVVSVMTIDGRQAALQSNGLSESHLDLVDPGQGSLVETLLGVVPVLLHPEPTRTFVVGFGGGNTALALTLAPAVGSVRVVELEPAVVDAVRTVSRGDVPALRDPRVELVINDARNTLLVENRSYDVIVSQPSHPWLAGNGSLFTREFFAMVRGRLNTHGIFGQWVNLFHMDATTLRSILRAFFDVFPHGFSLVFPTGERGGDFLLFASTEALTLSPLRFAERLESDALRRALGRHGIERVSDLLRYFALSRNEAMAAAAGIEPNTDTNLTSEVRLAALDRQPSGEEDPLALLRGASRFDVADYLPPRQVADIVGDVARAHAALEQQPRARAALERLRALAPERAATLARELATR